MITVTVRPLHQRLCTLRINSRVKQKTVAAAIGVDATSVGRWERGASSPNATLAIAYVTHLGHRMLVRRRGVIVGCLTQVLGDLAGFREGLLVSKTEMARRLHMGEAGVANIEKRAARGGVRLAGVERYLYALDAVIVIAPIEAVTPC